MKKSTITIITIFVFVLSGIFLFYMYREADPSSQALDRIKSKLPANSYDIQDLGNDWIGFSLDSNRFIIYSDGHQRCVTQVK